MGKQKNKEIKKQKTKQKTKMMFSTTKSNTLLTTLAISALGTQQSAFASPVYNFHGCSSGTETVNLDSIHHKYNSKHFGGYIIDAQIKHVDSKTKPDGNNWGFEDD